MIKTPIKAIHCPIAVNRFFPLKIQNMLNIRWLYTKFYQAEVFKEIMVLAILPVQRAKTGFKYVFSHLSVKCLLVYLSMRSEIRYRDSFRRIFK